MPPFFFWDLGSSLLSLLSIIFQVDCLSPLHLVFLVSFYLAVSSARYFFVFSFCHTYCVCGLLSAGCRIVAPLASGVCPLLGEVGPETCTVIPLIGALIVVVMTRAWLGYWAEPPLFWGCHCPVRGRVCSLVVGVVAPRSTSYLFFWYAVWGRWDWNTPTGKEATEYSSSGAVHLWMCSAVSTFTTFVWAHKVHSFWHCSWSHLNCGCAGNWP